MPCTGFLDGVAFGGAGVFGFHFRKTRFAGGHTGYPRFLHHLTDQSQFAGIIGANQQRHHRAFSPIKP